MSMHDEDLLAVRFAALAPQPLVGDWGEVVGRLDPAPSARRRQGRLRARARWALVTVAAAILVVGLLVMPGLGLGGRLLDLIIESTPEEPQVQTPVWSPGGRKVLFSSRRDGNWDIYVVNADGSGQQNLTRNPARDGLPASSPDGRRIAFVRHREGGDALYVMNGDGSGQRMLVRRGNSPAWSPDGRKVAFWRAGGMFVVNPDGSELVRLRRGPGGRRASLVWSPDGRQLAFLGDIDRCDFCFDLYVMNADGSGLRNVTQRLSSVSDPAWSPDGRKIGLVSESDGNNDVFVMNADGSGLRRLTRSPASDSAPAWSPDGRRIAFVTNRNGIYEVYVMNADGSRQVALAAPTVGGHGTFVGEVAAPDPAPAWSPDGRRIAFVSDRNGTFEVYVMNADGSGQRRLTRDEAS
jgi:TolB protein